MSSEVTLFSISIRILIFILAILGIGFFSGSETAFLAMDGWAIKRLCAEGDEKASLLKTMARHSKNTISALLVGTNVLTALSSVTASSIFLVLGFKGVFSIAVVSLVTTAVVFIFSELIPKSYAAMFPTETALSIARPLMFLSRVLKPVSFAATAIPNFISSLLTKQKTEGHDKSDKPVRVALNMAEEDGYVKPEETKVIYGVLNSRDKKASEIMLSMKDVITFSPKVTLATCMEVFRKYRYSRIPVVSENRNEVLGVAYMKDVVEKVVHSREQITQPVTSVMREPFFVSSEEKILDLLSKFKKKKIHFAVVRQEKMPAGIVTMEDILEEILGDIPEDSRVRLTATKKPPNISSIFDEGVSDSFL